jgi:hypothetical protein
VSVPLSEVTLVNNRMRFNSRGLAPDIVAAERIPLVNTAGRKELRINRLGNIRMQ